MYLFTVFKEHEVYEKTCSKKNSFDLHIQIHRKGDSKILCISESFSRQTCPLFRDSAHVCWFVQGQNIKVHISATFAWTERPNDLQNCFFHLILYGILGKERMPILDHISNRVARWRLDFKLLQATRKTAASTLQRTSECHHFLSHVILNMEDEWTQWSTELSITAVVFLRHKEHLLPHTVLHCVLIIGLPSQYSFCQLNFLLYKKLINLSQIIQSRWAASGSLWNWHHKHLTLAWYGWSLVIRRGGIDCIFLWLEVNWVTIICCHGGRLQITLRYYHTREVRWILMPKILCYSPSLKCNLQNSARREVGSFFYIIIIMLVSGRQ